MKNFLLCFFMALLTSACASTVKNEKSMDEESAALNLSPASFEDLQGWSSDDMKDFLPAFKKSCSRILKKSPDEAFSSNQNFGIYRDWQAVCEKASATNESDAVAVHGFIEQNFKVVKASAGNDPQGLFTGYYESTLNGSRTKHGLYQHPLLARPSDLVMVELGDFRDELKGQRIAGRVRDGKLKPYENRADIVSGKLPADLAKPLVWLDDPQDAFFVQVQGSGIVHLDEGGIMRVGYDGQNGHPYYAIGRELVKRGIYSKEEVSMDSVRAWLNANPSEAAALMNTNPSYVFFRETPDDGTGAGPQGGEGVKLTPRRSLAIDKSKIPYGMPVWLDVRYNDSVSTPIQRLMVTQDTGGAIRGPVRGDFFWGSGVEAEKMAGPMKARGGYYFLLPKTIQ